MANVTYDPILMVQNLPRFRMTDPPRPPRPGTALVLETNAGTPVVVWPGQAVPEARTGNYRRMYLINVEHYSLRLEEVLPSADPAFSFQCVLTFHCGVRDPALIAFRNIRDVTSAMRLLVVRHLRWITRQYDVGQINEAEMVIDRELASYTGDQAFTTGGYLVELTSDSGYHDVRRDIRLGDMRRGAMQPVVDGGNNTVRAELLANQDGKIMDLLRLDANTDAMRVEQALAAARIQAGEVEDFDTRQLRQNLLGQALGDRAALPQAEDDQPSSRRKRLAGQIEAAGGPATGAEAPGPVRAMAERMDDGNDRGRHQPQPHRDEVRPRHGG